MRRIDLAQTRLIMTAEELEFAARLDAWLDQQEAEWQAQRARRGRPPSKQEWQYFAMWQAMVEEREWERFYGPVVEMG